VRPAESRANTERATHLLRCLAMSVRKALAAPDATPAAQSR